MGLSAYGNTFKFLENINYTPHIKIHTIMELLM